MKCIVLAAGYATRLYPLTKNQPKPLLLIKGKPILDYIIERVLDVKEVDEIFVVSNGKFYKNFIDYVNSEQFSKPVKILNDRTTTNKSRLGGIGNLWLAIEQDKIDEDILVILGDNIFNSSLNETNDLFNKTRKCVLGVFDIKDLEASKRFGVVEIDKCTNKILNFEEKPENPKSTLISTGIYFIPKEKIKEIKEYLEKGFSKEGVGFFFQWMLERDDVYAFPIKGEWYDIGSKEIYDKVNKEWEE